MPVWNNVKLIIKVIKHECDLSIYTSFNVWSIDVDELISVWTTSIMDLTHRCFVLSWHLNKSAHISKRVQQLSLQFAVSYMYINAYNLRITTLNFLHTFCLLFGL